MAVAMTASTAIFFSDTLFAPFLCLRRGPGKQAAPDNVTRLWGRGSDFLSWPATGPVSIPSPVRPVAAPGIPGDTHIPQGNISMPKNSTRAVVHVNFDGMIVPL